MKKRKKKPRPSPEDEELIREFAGQGVPTELIHRAWWWPEPDLPWLSALDDFENRDDPASLLKLLKPLVPATIFPHLVDMFDRKKLRHYKSGNPRTPSYFFAPPEEERLWVAGQYYRRLVAEGKSHSEAREAARRAYGINEDKFINYLNVRRGSTRRLKTRLPRRP